MIGETPYETSNNYQELFKLACNAPIVVFLDYRLRPNLSTSREVAIAEVVNSCIYISSRDKYFYNPADKDYEKFRDFCEAHRVEFIDFELLQKMRVLQGYKY